MSTAGTSTSDGNQGRRNRALFALFALYGAFWLALAMNPIDRLHWFLENLLVFALVPVLIVGWRRFRFSTGSYVLITLFLMLHTYGAHHTYSLTPLGDWLRVRFELERNHYDRLVHFAFGVCFAPPVWEWLTGRLRVRARIGAGLAVCVILSAGALYEILEAIVALLVDPELGAAFTGTQGDEWDAQKDMALALFGAVLVLTGVMVRRRFRETRSDQPTESA